MFVKILFFKRNSELNVKLSPGVLNVNAKTSLNFISDYNETDLVMVDMVQGQYLSRIYKKPGWCQSDKSIMMFLAKCAVI